MSGEGLVERLRIKAGMLRMGERIAWGSDADALEEAAARIQELEAALRECESIAKQANAIRVRGPILTTSDRFVMIQDAARRTLRGE